MDSLGQVTSEYTLHLILYSNQVLSFKAHENYDGSIKEEIIDFTFVLFAASTLPSLKRCPLPSLKRHVKLHESDELHLQYSISQIMVTISETCLVK